jgi:glycosyltransferase involved in cell wall biosynthesis
VDTFLRPLLAEHQARGHHVELAFGRSSDEPLDFGVPVHRYPIERSIRPDQFLMAVRGLKRIIRQGRYDVIVAHMALVGVAARIAFALSGRPSRMVYASHGLPCYLARNWTARLIALQLERVLNLWTDGIIVLNSFDFRMATKYKLGGPKRQVHFLHTVGIPYNDIVARTSALYRRAYRQGLGLAPDRPVIMYAGRFIKAKGVQVYLEIARRMVGGGVKAQFAIAGTGPLEGYVQRFIETNHLGEHVRLLGWYDDVKGLLAASDILCLPTFYEGAPVVVQEAMAAGCVVVASDVPGPQDLIDHRTTGILVPPGDVGQFCDVIADLLTNKTWHKELIESAWHHAAQFDASIWAPAWVEAIESVARTGHEKVGHRL